MEVHIGLVCLLLGVFQGVLAQNGTSYGSELSAQPMTATPLVTKELVFTCTAVNSSSLIFKEIFTIAIVAVEKDGDTSSIIELAKIDNDGPWIRPGGVFDNENITGDIYRHPAEKTTIQTSGTGYLRLSISYPTLQQIQSSSSGRTVCMVSGRDSVSGLAVQESRSVHVNVTDHTFQSLGGYFEVNPTNIKALLTEILSVKCNIDGVEAVKTVNEISIVKDGIVVATKARGHSPHTNTSNFPNATIKGDLLDSNSGYLIATVNYPMEVHSGSFECMIKVDNQEGRELVATSRAVHVNETDPGLKDIIQRVHDQALQIKHLTVENTAQQMEINATKSKTETHEARLNTLESSNSNHETRLNTLESSNSNHETRLNTLESSNSNHETRLNTLESSNSNHETRLNTLTSSNSNHETRITENESDINEFKRIKQGVSYCNPPQNGLSDKQINFGITYRNIPKIHISVREQRGANEKDANWGIYALNVNRYGFTLRCQLYYGSKIDYFNVNWIAFPQ